MYVRRGRRGGMRRRTGVAKKALWRRPTARNQRSQIYSLAKSVGRLRNNWTKMSTKQTWSEYGQVNLYATDASGQGYSSLMLMNPTTWGAIFANTNVAGDSNKTLVQSMTLGLRFNLYGQPAPVCYHLFIVSLRRSAGTLNINALVNGQHYETQPMTTAFGMQSVVLNPKVFHVHRRKTFTLAQNAQAKNQPQTAGQGFPPCSWKEVKYKLYPKLTIRNYNGDWKSLQELDLPTTQRYYLLCFFNNSFPGPEAYNHMSFSNIWVTRNMF